MKSHSQTFSKGPLDLLKFGS